MRLLLLLFLASSVLAQERVVEQKGFGGLVNKVSDRLLPEGASTQAHNVDFGYKVGALYPRFGRTTIATASASAFDSLFDLGVGVMQDKRSYLIFAGDSLNVSYGGLYTTQPGGLDITAPLLRKVTKYWPVTPQSTNSYANWKGYTFAVNGVTRGAVLNGKASNNYVLTGYYGRPWPLVSPGEVLTTPLKTSGNLNGSYRYAFQYQVRGNQVKSFFGRLTLPVKVVNGQVLLTEFQLPARDTATATTKDTATVTIWRTTGDVGYLDAGDTIWNTGQTVTLDSTTYQNASFTDTMSDATLRTKTFRRILPKIATGKEFVIGSDADSLTSQYGAIGFVGARGASVATNTVWGGMDTLPILGLIREVAGWRWVAQFFDSVTGNISDTGGGLAYLVNGDASQLDDMVDTIKQFRLRTPRNYDTTLRVLIWRQPLIRYRGTPYTDDYQGYKKGDSIGFNYIDSLNATGLFYFVGMYKCGDTLIDSVRYDSLLTRKTLRLLAPTEPFSKIYMDANYMYGVAGSRVWRSLLDTPFVFSPANSISFDEDDGTDITGIVRKRTSLFVTKPFKSFGLTPEFDARELLGMYGSLSKDGMVSSGSINYMLSEKGVISTSEGRELERAFEFGLLSDGVNNFDLLPVSTKSVAYAFYHDQKALFVVGDTTYVYDERSKTWATWTFPVESAVHYGASSNVTNSVNDSLYFFMAGGRILYRYGATTDDGNSIGINWTSTPYFDDRLYDQINAIGLWAQGASDDSVAVALYDETGAQVTGISPSGNSLTFSLANRYNIMSLQPKTSLYYKVAIATVGGVGNSVRAIIDGLDLYCHKQGEVERK